MEDKRVFVKKIAMMGQRLVITIPSDKVGLYSRGDWVIVQPFAARPKSCDVDDKEESDTGAPHKL